MTCVSMHNTIVRQLNDRGKKPLNILSIATTFGLIVVQDSLVFLFFVYVKLGGIFMFSLACMQSAAELLYLLYKYAIFACYSWNFHGKIPVFSNTVKLYAHAVAYPGQQSLHAVAPWTEKSVGPVRYNSCCIGITY